MNLIANKEESIKDEIDVRQLLHTLWLQRKVIIQIAFVSAAVRLGVAQLSTWYVSEAVLQLPQKKEFLDPKLGPKKEQVEGMQRPKSIGC